MRVQRTDGCYEKYLPQRSSITKKVHQSDDSSCQSLWERLVSSPVLVMSVPLPVKKMSVDLEYLHWKRR